MVKHFKTNAFDFSDPCGKNDQLDIVATERLGSLKSE